MSQDGRLGSRIQLGGSQRQPLLDDYGLVAGVPVAVAGGRTLGLEWDRMASAVALVVRAISLREIFSLLRILIIGIEREDFVHVGQGGLEIALRLVDEGAHLIILWFLRAELDRFAVIVQRPVVILQLHLGVGASLKNIGILCFHF